MGIKMLCGKTDRGARFVRDWRPQQPCVGQDLTDWKAVRIGILMYGSPRQLIATLKDSETGVLVFASASASGARAMPRPCDRLLRDQ